MVCLLNATSFRDLSLVCLLNATSFRDLSLVCLLNATSFRDLSLVCLLNATSFRDLSLVCLLNATYFRDLSLVCLLNATSFRDLLKLFTTSEIMRWKDLGDKYEKELRANFPGNLVFNPKTEDGTKRWKDLKARVVEHVSRPQPIADLVFTFKTLNLFTLV